MSSHEQKGNSTTVGAAILLLLMQLALSFPASALTLITPADGETVGDPGVLVSYVTSSVSCQATVNGIIIPLDGCRNFTMSAVVGENTISLWDGTERQEARFTYRRGAAPEKQDFPKIRGVAPAAGPPQQRFAPGGVIIRGKTPYMIPTARVSRDGEAAADVTDLRNRSGEHDIELRPIGSRIHRIVFKDVILPQTIDLGLEELGDIDTGLMDLQLDAFAIDPTRVNFSNGTLTKTAVGNRVWKCAQWDFDNETCTGDWVMEKIITPDASYDIDFNATDPAYVETFESNPAVDVDIAALDNTTIVLAYVDNLTGNVSFEIWDTFGTQLLDKTFIDNNSGVDSRVSVDPINTTHFVVGVIDGPEDDGDFYVFDRWGTQTIGQTQVDPSAGDNTDVDVCELGDRFAYAWIDQNDGDANFEIWSNAGAQIVNENQVDTSTTPSAIGQNLGSCSAVNSSLWGYAFYDDADNDATLAFVQGGGTIQVAETDIDADVGETGQVATAGLRDDRLALAFYDSTDQDITITVRATNGGAMATVLANTDIDTAAGTDSRVAAAAVSNDSLTDFVVAWQDNGDATIKAAVYNGSGVQITAPFTVTATPNATNPVLAVTGYNTALGFGLCNGTFAIAYTNATSNPVFETYYLNGTRWDGLCGAADTNAPIITLINPANNATNDTSNLIDFTFNISDASPIANCTFYLNENPYFTRSSPQRDATLNVSINLDNGNYNWSVECYDAQDNYNRTETQNFTVNVPLLISGSDVRLAALDNTTIVIAYIDVGQNDATFEIWDTNGTRIVNAVDVDTSVDAASRVAVDAINNTHFVIAVLDGPIDDATFYTYTRDGTPAVGLTQIDPSAGDFTDIDICELGDRFAYPWADQNDGDANFEIWSNVGAQIANENQVDTSMTAGATLQNLVACGAVNSSLWGYAFYDDQDNDATLAFVQGGGTIQVAETDIDADVGETGQVGAAGLRDDRLALAFYDSTDQDITITVRATNGGAMATVLANTDIDTAAGNDSRVAVAEVENNSASNFVVAWQDEQDYTIKAAVYNGSGVEVTAPFNITTAENNASPLLDVVGFHSATGLGLCNQTFVIVYTNSTNNTVFETYYLNGTRWDGSCGVAPNITNVSVPMSVVLNAGTTKTVTCNISVLDPSGADKVLFANATLYHQTSQLYAANNNTKHYTNSSCAETGSFDVVKNYTCSFEVQYYAFNGTWTCAGYAHDVYHRAVFGEGNGSIDPLFAINISNTTIDFGTLEVGNISLNVTENLTNVGNQPINVSALGYGSEIGDNNAFACPQYNISVGYVKFAPNATANYTQKENLTGSLQPIRVVVSQQVDAPIATNISYWQVQPPLGVPAGECNGTIVFQAESTT